MYCVTPHWDVHTSNPCICFCFISLSYHNDNFQEIARDTSLWQFPNLTFGNPLQNEHEKWICEKKFHGVSCCYILVCSIPVCKIETLAGCNRTLSNLRFLSGIFLILTLPHSMNLPPIILFSYVKLHSPHPLCYATILPFNAQMPKRASNSCIHFPPKSQLYVHFINRWLRLSMITLDLLRHFI